MIRYSSLSPNHRTVADTSTASDPDLRRYHAAEANVHVMTDLHEVIDHGTRADYGIAKSASVDCAVGADFDIVPYQNSTELRYAYRAARS